MTSPDRINRSLGIPSVVSVLLDKKSKRIVEDWVLELLKIPIFRSKDGVRLTAKVALHIYQDLGVSFAGIFVRKRYGTLYVFFDPGLLATRATTRTPRGIIWERKYGSRERRLGY